MRMTQLTQLAFSAVLAAGVARGNPVTWNLHATLTDGATVTGFFVFDPDLGSHAQYFTSFDINIGAAAPGILPYPGDNNLPTSIFFPFDFTPSNSVGLAFSGGGGLFAFLSDTEFPNPIPWIRPESLVLQFLPASPLTDTSSTVINNRDISSGAECFNCDPYVLIGSPSPEPGQLPPLAFGVCALAGVCTVRRRRERRCCVPR